MISFSPISNKTTYINKQNFQKNQTKTQTINKQNPTKATKKKTSWLIPIALGATALAVSIGVIISSRGKALQNKKLLSEIPEDLLTHFEQLKGLEGKEFIDKAFKELVSYMKLEGIAPKSIGKHGCDNVLSISGGYNYINNTIDYTEGFFTKLQKNQQINMLAHELKHCEQLTNILRTEGLGVEKYTDAIVESTLNKIKNDPLDFEFSFALKRAKAAGKEQEFWDTHRKIWAEEISKSIKENFKDILKMPKIKADSPEGIKAFKDLESQRNYEGLNFLGLGSENYQNNSLEVDAYGFGDKIEELFKKYLKATT